MSNGKDKIQQGFAELKSKYKAECYEDSSPDSLLYLILKKAELDIDISDLELDWLKERELLKTIEIIIQQPKDKIQSIKEMTRRFAKLKLKYKVRRVPEIPLSNPLYPIMVKLESEHQITDSEQEWLKQNNYENVIKISLQMKHFLSLKTQYQATKCQDYFPDSYLYGILEKLDVKNRLSDSEVNWLNENQLFETLAIFRQYEAEREAEFAQLKEKYKAVKHSETSVSSPLYLILKKLDADKLLSESELDFLVKNELSETLDIFREIEKKHDFIDLKIKYKATQYEDSSPSSHLYKVLKKIDSDIQLSEADINFLKKRKLTDTIAVFLNKYSACLKSKLGSGEQLIETEIEWLKTNGFEDIITRFQVIHFTKLKSKYLIDNDKYNSPSSPLYAILQKLEKKERLEPTEVGWLRKNKFFEDKIATTYHEIEWLKTYGSDRSQVIHFTKLKSKYEIDNDKSLSIQLYAILQKLEKKERLEPTEVAWLYENKIFENKFENKFKNKIAVTYHQIEATFYEEEYKQTSNKWNLPNASSHWRSAYEAERALELTKNLNFDQIKEDKLKSALLTTRGGAFRDIYKLNNAEKCALKAIEYYPKSHHPYTLMGAISFERGEYPEGYNWFKEAIERGASPNDADGEIKRILKTTKDENKRDKLVKYLLEKDPKRYKWAKFYLKNPKNKDK